MPLYIIDLPIDIKKLRLTLLLLVALTLTACGQKRNETNTLQTVHFKVDSSLLAQSVVDDALGVRFSPPKGWQAIPEKVLKTAERFARLPIGDTLKTHSSGRPRVSYAWSDALTKSVVIVSQFPNFDTSDSSRTLQEYKSHYQVNTPDADVRTTVFYSKGFKVHQLRLSNSEHVLFKMVFSNPQIKHPVQFDFVVPAQVYSRFITTIESVAGSIDNY